MVLPQCKISVDSGETPSRCTMPKLEAISGYGPNRVCCAPHRRLKYGELIELLSAGLGKNFKWIGRLGVL